eukprot:7178879-Ditylum_brightwellii.AAC.1
MDKNGTTEVRQENTEIAGNQQYASSKSSVVKLYLHWLKCGHGLTGVEDTYTGECSTLAKYVMCNDNPITQIVHDMPPPTQNHLMRYASAPCFCTPDLTNT